MNIGLIDVDSHNFPNLALMKISAYHKNKGHSVTMLSPMHDGHYNIIYKSKVFTFSTETCYCATADQTLQGGTGYNSIEWLNTLSYDIEHTYPDYGIYGINDTAYGFTSRGCPRGCEFCIVADKEGKKSTKVASVHEFWKGQKHIELLDPNLLACNEHMQILEELADTKARVNLNQGIDARLLNRDNSKLLKAINSKIYHFAWDYMKNENIILPKLRMFKKITGVNGRRLMVYVLTNFNTTHAQDVYRVEKLKGMGFDPYVMIYDKQSAPRATRRLQRYTNNKIIFRATATFREYNT